MSQLTDVGVPADVSGASGAIADQSVQSHPLRWTPLKFCQSVVLFILAAAAEVGGGWLVWQSIRTGRPWWWGLLGGIILIVYGFIPTLQPVDHFGRTFAVYGGFFIVYSYGWGWLLDSQRPDKGRYHVRQLSIPPLGQQALSLMLAADSILRGLCWSRDCFGWRLHLLVLATQSVERLS